ncbi:MAG: hypothetical protein K5882_02320 [Bacteroidales bacterium]|nr:hypothetical protein [Bacteroidales bacterium]
MNINNIIKLIKAYFYENWQKDLYTFGLVLIFAFLSMAWPSLNSFLGFSVIVVLIAIYPLRFFDKLHQPSSRIHYLMIPATNEEKVLTGILLTNIYFILLVFISAFIGALLGYGVLKLSTPEMEMNFKEMLGLMLPSSVRSYLFLITMVSIIFFGSIYFKKSPAWKIVLVCLAVFLVLGAIMTGTEWLNVLMTVPAEIRNGNYIKVEHSIMSSSKWTPYVINIVITVYFYAMSFLRMRETEA